VPGNAETVNPGGAKPRSVHDSHEIIQAQNRVSVNQRKWKGTASSDRPKCGQVHDFLRSAQYMTDRRRTAISRNGHKRRP
jgi:hypothetical protein